MFIAKMFRAVNVWLAKLFKGQTNLENNTNKAIYIVNMIKGTLNSPLLDVAVNSTITPEDDKVLNELRTVLAFASKELGIVTDGLVNGNTIALLNDIKTHLNKLTESNKNAILQAIAVIVLKQLETEISTAEANLFISAKYVEKKL